MKIDSGFLQSPSLSNTLSSRSDRVQSSAQSVELTANRLSDSDAKAISESVSRHQPHEPLPALDPSETPKFVVFEGQHISRGMPASAQTDRMQAIMDLLPSDEAKNLVDMGLIADEDFIDFASNLSEEDLINFAKVALGLQTKSQIGGQVVLEDSGRRSAEKLMHSLSKLDSQAVSRTLSIASELSAKIPKIDLAATYDVNGRLPQGSSSANDLHNFVKAINSIGGSAQGADTELMLDNLANYSQQQQSSILQVLARDVDLGTRVMDNLADYSQDTQDSMLSYLSKLTSTISAFSVGQQPNEAPPKLPEGQWSGSIIDVDKNDEYVILGMIDKLMTVTESYQFDDEQLDTMASDLKGMGNVDQRAYIEITATGLDTLLNGDSESPVDLEQHQDALEVIDDLRSSDIARDLITKSRKGQEHFSDGRAFYEYKDTATSERDQQQTIELLTKDAWLHPGETPRNNQFAANLERLDADQRDTLIDDLNSSGRSRDALADYSAEQLAGDYEALINRSNSIAESHDIVALLELESALPETQKQQFWQAADFIDNDIDKFVSVMEKTRPQEQQLLLDFISALSDAVDQDEIQRPDALQQATETLNKFLQ